MADARYDARSVTDQRTRLAALIERVNAGDGGLPVLHQLVELTRSVLGAVGASFTEYGTDGGRVIAAVGALDWAVGRWVRPAGPVKHRLLTQDQPVECPVTALPKDFAGHLAARGVIRMLAVRCHLGDRVVGSLHAFFGDGDGTASAADRATIRLFGTWAAHLYADGNGLPVEAEAPPAGTPAEAVVVVGPDGAVRSFGPAAARLLAHPVERAVGRPLPVPVPAPGRSGEHRLPDGRWLHLTNREVPDGDGSYAVTLRDVTEARQRDEARELFVAVTGHGLRTPVTVIQGYADTLVNHWHQLDDAARLEAAQRLDQRARELARLVERLLDAVGAGSARREDAAGTPFELAGQLRLVVAELPEDLRPGVRVELPERLPTALGEPSSLAVVLTELVTNATKYSPGPAEIELRGVADSHSVGFTVADRGIGVPAEHVERAFERFWQAESGDRRRYGGVGLGLYLVRQLLERQNGWVSLRPRESGGTVAEVRLPRAETGPGEA